MSGRRIGEAARGENSPGGAEPDSSSGIFTVRDLDSLDEFRQCVEMQKEIWGAEFVELVPASILRAAVEIGGVAAGAFTSDGTLAGFVFGLTGVKDGRPTHWSDILAVRRVNRGQRLGERMKRHQRDVLLARGVENVWWTFDPLESRNAHLNINRLGANALDYLPDYYGTTASALHDGIGTDRLLVHWEIGATADTAGGRTTTHSLSRLSADVVPAINPTRFTTDGLECLSPDLGLDAPRIGLEIPRDIQSLKQRSPALARRWRARTRSALQHYLAGGYRITHFDSSGGRSFYVLSRMAPAASGEGRPQVEEGDT